MGGASCRQWRLPRGISLRPIVDADLPFLSDLYASTRWGELAQVPWSEADKRAFLHQQHTLQHRHYQMHYAGAEFLVVQRNASSIGRIYLHRSPGELRLMDIALLQSERGRGLGGILMGELVNDADVAQLPITLHVERDNPARRLYVRHHFELEEDGEVYQKLRREPRPLASVED
jgi:ribosomal protein S18 acetylase RimI-like enzyme